MITVYGKYHCICGEAPAEAMVNNMLIAMDVHARAKGLSEIVDERVYWVELPFKDDMVFAIYRDYINDLG